MASLLIIPFALEAHTGVFSLPNILINCNTFSYMLTRVAHYELATEQYCKPPVLRIIIM